MNSHHDQNENKQDFLVDKNMVQALEDLQLAENKFYRHSTLQKMSNKLAELKNDIIKIENQLFAISANELNKGKEGVVFKAQNLSSGEWIALKRFDLTEWHKNFLEKYPITVEHAKNQRLLNEPDSNKHEKIKILYDSYKTKLSAISANKKNALKPKRESLNNEVKVLEIMESSQGKLIEFDNTAIPNGELIYFIPMKLAPGRTLAEELSQNLHRVRNDKPTGDIKKLFSIAEKFGETLCSALEKKVILCDISLGNFMYESKTNTFSAIDFGDAGISTDDVCVVRRTAVGSEPFMPPEILEKQDLQGNQPDEEIEYSEKTMVYSFGAILSRMFGLTAIVDSTYIKSEKTDENGTVISRAYFKTIQLHQPPPQNSPLKEIRSLIEQMIETEPAKRINLKEACIQLREIAANYNLEITLKVSAYRANNMFSPDGIRSAPIYIPPEAGTGAENKEEPAFNPAASSGLRSS